MAKNPLNNFGHLFSFKDNFSAQMQIPKAAGGGNLEIKTIKSANIDTISASLATDFQAGVINFAYVSQKEIQFSIEVYEVDGNFYHTIFSKIMNNLYDAYPDDSFFKIQLFKLADWGDRDRVEVLYELPYCFLTSVSQMNFDASSQKLQTITLQFITDPKKIKITRK